MLSKKDFKLNEMPYSLRLKNLTGYYEPCQFCNDQRCEGCPLPYTSEQDYFSLLRKIGAETNCSYYPENYQRKGRNEVIIEVVWGLQMSKQVFENFSAAKPHPLAKTLSPEEHKDG